MLSLKTCCFCPLHSLPEAPAAASPRAFWWFCCVNRAGSQLLPTAAGESSVQLLLSWAPLIHLLSSFPDFVTPVSSLVLLILTGLHLSDAVFTLRLDLGMQGCRCLPTHRCPVLKVGRLCTRESLLSHSLSEKGNECLGVKPTPLPSRRQDPETCLVPVFLGN